MIYIIWYIIHRSQSICLVNTIPSRNKVFETNQILEVQNLQEKREKVTKRAWRTAQEQQVYLPEIKIHFVWPMCFYYYLPSFCRSGPTRTPSNVISSNIQNTNANSDLHISHLKECSRVSSFSKIFPYSCDTSLFLSRIFTLPLKFLVKRLPKSTWSSLINPETQKNINWGFIKIASMER